MATGETPQAPLADGQRESETSFLEYKRKLFQEEYEKNAAKMEQLLNGTNEEYNEACKKLEQDHEKRLEDVNFEIELRRKDIEEIYVEELDHLKKTLESDRAHLKERLQDQLEAYRSLLEETVSVNQDAIRQEMADGLRLFAADHIFGKTPVKRRDRERGRRPGPGQRRRKRGTNSPAPNRLTEDQQRLNLEDIDEDLRIFLQKGRVRRPPRLEQLT